jgi:adenine-specific DNA-methyltransferase
MIEAGAVGTVLDRPAAPTSPRLSRDVERGGRQSVRYIGSKARVAAMIAGILGPWPGSGRFIDAFCGTGSVGRRAAELGWPIVLNDHLTSSMLTAAAQVIARADVPFRSLGGYEAALQLLNQVGGIDGFVWKEYSPASRAHGVQRQYFTEKNAARIDAVRQTIAQWRAVRLVTELEERLLIADLLAAANRVANIAGTYGCFLSYWTTNSARELLLSPRRLSPTKVHFEATCLDVFNVRAADKDTVYLDPPYTKRQYAAYYHLLETIAEGDAPVVTGITGLRPWEHKASVFCYKTRALAGLQSLIQNLPAHRVLLSYSDDAHIPLEALRRHLADLGNLTVHRLASIGRYRPNERASAHRSAVSEYLLELRRPAVALNCQPALEPAV